MNEQDKLDETRKLMAALLRMPPKPHAEMKIGRRPTKGGGTAKKKIRAGAAKPGTA